MPDSRGFTLFELLITLAVIGVVSAFAIPAYRSYIDTANMTKVSAQFEESVRVAQQTFNKDATRVALGLSVTRPNTTADWITLFNRDGANAPGGGPAYVSGSPNAQTGAIGVLWIPPIAFAGVGGGETLILRRPKYSSLVEQTAYVSRTGVKIFKF